MELAAISARPSAATRQPDVIHWKQLWSLAALYASIIIGWIAYQNYQPRLLVQFHFTDFSFALILCQSLILTITPLVAGKIGDRYRFKTGHRLPIISAGISFAAMVFMAVAFTLLGNPGGELFRWLLPLLIVFWLVAMSLFTSPALSTIELFTPVDKLPRAMAVLTIAGNVVYSLEPVIVEVIDYLGAPVTFILGGTVVFVSGYALKKNSLALFNANGDREEVETADKKERSRYGFVFLLGLAMGVATTVLFYLFPSLLHDKLRGILEIDGNIMVAGMLFFSALISWPVCDAVNRYGTQRMLWISLSVIPFTIVGIFFSTIASVVVVCALFFSIAFTFLSIASLPLAINRAAFREKVFCVGIFFSAAAIPEGIWEALTAYQSS